MVGLTDIRNCENISSTITETLAFHTIPDSKIIDTFGYRECPRQ
jgi:hypothetical protein